MGTKSVRHGAFALAAHVRPGPACKTDTRRE